MDTNQEKSTRARLDPQDNKLQVSNKRNARAFFFICKIFLQKFGNCELHALGAATKTAVRVAENLQRQGLVTIEKINSFTHQSEGSKRVKLVISLNVTKDGETRINQELKN